MKVELFIMFGIILKIEKKNKISLKKEYLKNTQKEE